MNMSACQLRLRIVFLGGVAAAALLLSGCQSASSGGPGKRAGGAVFFPPPPDAPVLQFLTSYSSEMDLRGKASGFARFVVGKDAPSRPLMKPYGLALFSNQLMICDSSLASLEVLDLARQRLRYVSPLGAGRLHTPMNVTADADGTYYVTDAGLARVLVYTPEGACVAVIDSPLTNAPPAAPAATLAERRRNFTWMPMDVALSSNRIYVADMKGQVVRIFDKATRKFLRSFPEGAEREDENKKLFQPTNLAQDAQGNIYVSDTAGFRVQKYDRDGAYLRTIGTGGTAAGQFSRPKGIAVDRDNRIYVVDAVSQVVQLFDSEGRLLLFFGEPGNGSPIELNLPAKVIVDYDHAGLFQKLAAPGFQIEYLVLVSNQYGDRKVMVFGFGRKKSL